MTRFLLRWAPLWPKYSVALLEQARLDADVVVEAAGNRRRRHQQEQGVARTASLAKPPLHTLASPGFHDYVIGLHPFTVKFTFPVGDASAKNYSVLL